MPDRQLDENGYVRDNTPQNRAHAIANCHLCDTDGYRGTQPCDHTDHTQAAQRGINLIRTTMGWNPPQTSRDET